MLVLAIALLSQLVHPRLDPHGAALAQGPGTPEFPTPPPTEPFPTIGPEVPTPGPHTPTPTSSPSGTVPGPTGTVTAWTSTPSPSTSTAVASSTFEPTPTPGIITLLHIPYAARRHDFDEPEPTLLGARAPSQFPRDGSTE